MELSRCQDHVPEVPFPRYGHRPLDGRDVMVFRIMNEYVHPRRVTPRVFCQALQPGNPFGLIKSQDNRLGDDLQVVRKMLFTSQADEPHRLRSTPNTFSSPLVGNMAQGDEVIDLVQRHYLEDGCGFRLWLDVTRPALNTLHEAKSVPDEACVDLLRSQLKAEGKKWGPRDAYHLHTLQTKVDLVGKNLRVYDGGAFLPLLRQSLDRGLRDPTTQQRFVGATRKNVIPLWPGVQGLAQQNLWLRPSWGNRASFIDALEINEALELVARAPYRGGVGQHSVTRCHRSSSQPDLRAFGAADIPKRRRFGRYTPMIGEQQLEIAYHKMSSIALYHKSRSRSLSPSRFADMLVSVDPQVEGFDSGACGKGNNTSGLLSEPRTAPPTRRMCGLQAKAPKPKKSVVPKNAFMHHVTEEYCPNCQEYHPTPELDSEWVRLQRFLQPRRGKGPHSPCQNCADSSHSTSNCLARCGFCGAPNPHRTNWDQSTAPPGFHGNPHMAPQCPVAKNNRCKCVAFPQFHVADDCVIFCSRKCGNVYTLGSSKHKNAMTCRSRCCMCGIKGHSGKECRLKACRCKAKHLGQDCGWNPACRVLGCGRYLCGLHCRECGSTEKPFVGWRCQGCLSGPHNDVCVRQDSTAG